MSQEKADNIGMRNILREKTFNSELKDLVGKITSHSKSISEDDVSSSKKDGLLAELCRLFYATHALSESINIPETSNLFYTQGAFINSHNELLPNLLKRYFNSLECKGFSILFGDYKRKSYSMSNTYFDKIKKKIFIGLYDDILIKINSSDLGYIASDQDLDQFVIQDDIVKDSVLYFIRINFLTNSLKQELFCCDDPYEYDYIYSPILMLIMPKSTLSPTELFKMISKDLAVPLYVLTKNFSQTIKPLAEDDFKTLIDKYGFILMSCFNFGLCKALIIKLDNSAYADNIKNVKFEEDIFVMDFIFSKLSLTFPECVKFRTDPNKIIIFYKPDFISEIKCLINEMSVGIHGKFIFSDFLIDSDVNDKVVLDLFF